MSEGTLNSRGWVALATLAATIAIFACVPTAQASFGFLPGSVGTAVKSAGGATETQAGAHPEFETSFQLNTTTDADGFTAPDGDLKDLRIELPPGALANPLATPRCAAEDFSPIEGVPLCATSTQVGVVELFLASVSPAPPSWSTVPLYNLVPQIGEPARLGFRLGRNNVVIDTSIRSGGDYGVTATTRNAPGGLLVYGANVRIWGVPAANAHDSERFRLGQEFPGDAEGNPLPTDVAPTAFFSNPTSCEGQPATGFAATSWQNPGQWVEERSPFGALSGCDAVPFPASLQVGPRERGAAAPSALGVTLSVPQSDNPTGLSTAALRSAVVRLPQGMAVNAASADGLAGCSPAQIGLGDSAPAACPEASKLGTVEIETPLLDHSLDGSVYLATQGTNPFNSLLALYIAVDDPRSGVVIKLPGLVSPDPITGQLTAGFEDNPQLPFSSLRLALKGGNRAALVNPSACGAYRSDYALTSWSGKTVNGSSSFTIDRNCDAASKFTPGFEAGATNPIAGRPSPFTLRVTRADGQQNVSRIDATLPEGVLAKLAGVALCPDSAAPSGSCPVTSQIGSATVGVGAGSNPLYVPQAGKAPTGAYLAGPYKGAPYSLVVKVPAQAGPFDLGTVAVRSAIDVDPTSAQVSVKSDPLPQILEGIPIAYRDIRVNINRPDFTLNPTSCDPMSVDGVIASAQGTSANVSDRFQVTNCAGLGFTPKLSLKVKGATKRGKYPALKAVLTAKRGQANIGRVSVALPHSEFLAQDHIQTICTRVQYAAEACPKGSIYGKATAWSPLLDKPLSGPVYLRSSSNPLPDLVAALRGQIDVDLVGRIDSKNGGIRTTFATVPDAAVSKFVLSMRGGRKGLLENSRNLCAGATRATVKMEGHNGKVHDFEPVLKNSCRGQKR